MRKILAQLPDVWPLPALSKSLRGVALCAAAVLFHSIQNSIFIKKSTRS